MVYNIIHKTVLYFIENSSITFSLFLCTGRLPTKDDMSSLMYCVATIQEVQRVSCVAPASLRHSTTKDVEVKGYKIPKETMMIVNISKFMMDPDVFPNPGDLIPERFIQNDGNKLQLRVNYEKSNENNK